MARIENSESGGQFCFLKVLIAVQEKTIKVEIIQNVPLLDEFEVINNFRLITVKDIGHLKLMSICSRKAKKDLYDLDIITDKFHDLEMLMTFLSEKEKIFDSDEALWLFDLDAPPSPSEDLNLLLAAEPINYAPSHGRPHHSDDLLVIIEPNKSLYAAVVAGGVKYLN